MSDPIQENKKDSIRIHFKRFGVEGYTEPDASGRRLFVKTPDGKPIGYYDISRETTHLADGTKFGDGDCLSALLLAAWLENETLEFKEFFK